ncbi:hypothetical protein EA457_00635 [Streptococcus dysgalactiae subsp. dysgalactiae]|uniref:Uncharacterized protein n=1 Tax=Streptococcus dysgalactiae subsp. dysgalactiae TaxID=99822 RepID=A0A9X7RX33_STRDY|nr:hypothetical protein [Streptococcus dysgalactiae subsp. dysgalactiae]QGG97887.1 hypothetical protein EA459_04135 [Streptococcus dysgalactiae subsp. dysgalactiae]QGH01177.1 hypothetical protein EA457_00635 [Streptococcus dysgalactiae subsp. dysgalactiae]QGH04110.1 hypothetical protein EA458_06330 [Streptococcus dysgalactiae subsp. dysgalactiae]
MTPLSLLFASGESFRIVSALLFLLTSLCFIILIITLLPKKTAYGKKASPLHRNPREF